MFKRTVYTNLFIFLEETVYNYILIVEGVKPYGFLFEDIILIGHLTTCKENITHLGCQ